MLSLIQEFAMAYEALISIGEPFTITMTDRRIRIEISGKIRIADPTVDRSMQFIVEFMRWERGRARRFNWSI